MLKWMADGRPVKPLIPIAVGEDNIAFPRRSVKAGVKRTHKLCPSPGKWLIPGQPAGVHVVQLRVDLPPVSNGHGPFFRQLSGRQVERLKQAHGVGKDRAATVQPAEAAVQALYGVGRVHDLPGGLGELEHGAYAVPVVAPCGAVLESSIRPSAVFRLAKNLETQRVSNLGSCSRDIWSPRWHGPRPGGPGRSVHPGRGRSSSGW